MYLEHNISISVYIYTWVDIIVWYIRSQEKMLWGSQGHCYLSFCRHILYAYITALEGLIHKMKSLSETSLLLRALHMEDMSLSKNAFVKWIYKLFNYFTSAHKGPKLLLELLIISTPKLLLYLVLESFIKWQ